MNCIPNASALLRGGLLGMALFFMGGLPTTVAAQKTSVVGKRSVCQGGFASGFDCNEADLMSVLTPVDLGATETCGNPSVPRLCHVNDLWGWTDPLTGKEFALVGREDATAFVDVTDPVSPVYVGQMLHNGSRPSSWRDIKTYKNYAYIVADGSGGLGIQVFDLSELYRYTETPITFAPIYVYGGFSSAHNIVINEDTGYAYVVGARGGTSCAGGLHMVSLENPTKPQFAGCFAHGNTGRVGSGYTHDAQCVVYHGPDADYQGHEICMGANETHISIADVTDKSAPIAIAKADYPFTQYAHQGWLTEDHKYYFQNDELDEASSLEVNRTRTLIWDVMDLDDPVLLKEYFGTGTSTDHNLYVKGNFVYQSNYIDGLHVLDINDVMNPVDVASFDTHPDNLSRYSGTWSNYPFFESGAVAVTSSVDGLFMVQTTAGGTFLANEEFETPEDFVRAEAYPNPFSDRLTISMTVPLTQQLRVTLYDVLGREVKVLYSGIVSSGVDQLIESEFADLPDGPYFYRIAGDDFTFTRPVTHVK